jgi:hypothetical protein
MTEESRLCYHAIPRIIIQPNISYSDKDTIKDSDKDTNDNSDKDTFDNGNILNEFILKYLENHRINLNIRQVNVL